jgi:uncharacterized cupin superfamily protein
VSIAHWDEIHGVRVEDGQIAATWWRIGEAAGSRRVGANRIRVDPNKRSTPAHVHLGEEETFFVLAGSGLSWQDGATFEIRAGDCLVHRPSGEAHTLVAGDDGLDVLAFGDRPRTNATFLPHANALRLGTRWYRVEALPGRPPDELDVPDPGPRPPTIVNVDDVEGEEWRVGEDVGGFSKELGARAGSRFAGLNLDVVPPGLLNTTPHFHSAEEELFVVLEGAGTLLLGDVEHPVRAGHVVARPPGTKIAHAFRAGPEGITVLLYGTREPNDITYYPRSRIFALRGIGLVGRLEPVSADEIR